MKNKVVIDASVFVSGFSEDEKYHKESREFLRRVAEEDILIVVPILTIFEILQAFYRNTNNPEMIDQIHNQLIDLNVSKGLMILNLEAAFLAYFVVHHREFNLKTADTIMVLTALREKCPLVSLDRQLLKAAGKKVETYTPAEWLNNS